jgi:hypothetical protein
MKHAVILLALVACGGGKSTDDGLIEAPILDDNARGSAGASAGPAGPVAAEQAPPGTAVTPLENPTAAELVLPPAPARTATGSQAELAYRKATEAIELAKQARWREASSRFREAVARTPLAPYFFDLCLTLYHEGKFGESLTSCDASLHNEPDAELRHKTERLIARVKTEASAQRIDVDPRGSDQRRDPPGSSP